MGEDTTKKIEWIIPKNNAIVCIANSIEWIPA